MWGRRGRKDEVKVANFLKFAEYFMHLVTTSINFNPVKLQHSRCKRILPIRVEQRWEPDHMALSEAG